MSKVLLNAGKWLLHDVEVLGAVKLTWIVVENYTSDSLNTFFLILIQLYSEKLPLDLDVNLQALAASCNGYVGADLEALCREAVLSARGNSTETNAERRMWSVTMNDWKHAKSIVGPSITRGVTVEVPKVSWEDIGGLNDLKVCTLLHCKFKLIY